MVVLEEKNCWGLWEDLILIDEMGFNLGIEILEDYTS